MGKERQCPYCGEITNTDWLVEGMGCVLSWGEGRWFEGCCFDEAPPQVGAIALTVMHLEFTDIDVEEYEEEDDEPEDTNTE